jgi:preprotein translocase subunit SecF
MFDLLGRTNIDFLGKRNFAFFLSGALSLLGVIALIAIGRGKANLGIDFAGGTAVQLKFDHPIKIDQARGILDRSGLAGAGLQEFSEGNRLLIRVKNLQTAIEEKVAEKITAAFSEGLPDNHFEVASSEEIGPAIGENLRKNALLAVGLAMVAIMIYISLRFEFQFGIAAAIATLHDVLAVLGIFYLLNHEMTPLIVTALLTLAGFSLTDKVVVFDRIRENLKLRKKEGLETIINGAINRVLSRTIVVSLTVFLVLVPIFFLGGEVIHDFSLVLLIGVVVGTYSSIFVASPILYISRSGGGKLSKQRA